MPDPISITGTAAGLISLGIQVTQSLVEFYRSYKLRDSALADTVERLERLSDTFQCLEKTLDRNVQTEQQRLISSIEISIKKCDELIHELQEECHKFYKTSSKGIVTAIEVAGRRATYPFRQSTLQKLDEDIAEIRDNLSPGLTVLQLYDNKRIQNSLAEVKHLLDSVRTYQISSDLRDWLKAPDATIDHNAACIKKYPGTGMWFVKSSVFSRWLEEQNSFLWLNGFAGSGKTVLCSTAIQFVLRHQGSDPSVGIAFFYFTFNDDSKRHESDMLRALLLQLSCQLQVGEADLTKLHDTYKAGIPPPLVLIEYLRRLIQRFRNVYIALDALDESPRGGPRQRVLDTLNVMQNWGIQGLHLFITSRDEPDIRDSLDSYIEQVAMRNGEIDKDIANSISGRFDSDRRLRKWLPHREEVQESLATRANGVFRWVECQLESLQLCPHSEYHLDLLLHSLPQSLDETYERILCNIDHHWVEDARRILTLLSFAARPLTVQELIDGMAVEIEDPPRLNFKRRLQDFEDLCAICPALIDIDVTGTNYEKHLTSTVRIAHFSVQEYLESERIRDQKAAIFGLSSSTAHAEIAQICLVYLLEHGFSSSELDKKVLEDYPLAHFAAVHWIHHYKNAMKPIVRLDEFILRLFQHQDSFVNWIKLHDADQNWPHIDFSRSFHTIAAPVYYASLLGLNHLLNQLTTAHVEDTTTPASSLMFTSKITRLVNAEGGTHGNALNAASYWGHEKVVQLLLDNGAEVNAQGGRFGNALHAASSRGYEKIVKLLLDNGAEVNAKGRSCDNALYAASSGGYERIVKLLLDNGAEVNVQGGMFDNALYAASSRGHEIIVKLLLDNEAEFNAQGGEYGNALQAASYGGHEKTLKLLLDNGAEVNVRGGEFSNALHAASSRGYEKIVKLLLDNGAEVNVLGGKFGNALHATLSRGYEKIVKLLLDNGAEVNVRGGGFGNALHAALSRGCERIVKLLLDNGAEINAQDGKYGNALQAASYWGHETLVKLLLNNGAEVNAQGGFFGNALQAASHGGHKEIVQLLLDNGAEFNAQGGEYGNALQAASYGGHEKIVKLLLDNGAEVNVRGGEFGNALYAALSGGFEKIVKLLLDNGAEVNIQGGEYGNPLQAASSGGCEKIVKLLLDNGAEINAQGGKYGNALQAASYGGHEKVVQLLLDNGAEVNAQGGRFGNALYTASSRGYERIVKLLLDNGAEVNVRGGEFGNALPAALSRGYEIIVKLLLDNGAEVNAQGGFFGNALQAASCEGHEEVVQLLLDNGAEVNAQGGEFGNALQAASCGGHKEIVQLLLDKGAEVNGQGGEYGSALQAASHGGHKEIIQLLLGNRAEVNAQDGFFGNALQAASHGGHEEIIQLLLDNGAEVNAQGGFFGNALQAASCEGHEELVQLLLDNGAEVNAQGGEFGNALQAASRGGHKEIVQLLLDKGAEANGQGGEYGKRCRRHHMEVTKK
ncbi:hypothetical protein MMC29_001682 [Sticta canariensis]|nr:hypothetical protein [Sticta canariensis]